MKDVHELYWQTSSFSGDNGACVEVAFTPDHGVGVRDTKDRSKPPHFYTAAEWNAFVAGVKAGEFDGPVGT